MKNNTKKYLIILGISFIILLLEVFFLKISGPIGLIICLISLYFLIGTIIRLIRLTGYFNEHIMSLIDILFI